MISSHGRTLIWWNISVKSKFFKTREYFSTVNFISTALLKFLFVFLNVLEEKPWDSFLLRSAIFSMWSGEKKSPVKKHLCRELAAIEV